jgi:hypothetical protein
MAFHCLKFLRNSCNTALGKPNLLRVKVFDIKYYGFVILSNGELKSKWARCPIFWVRASFLKLRNFPYWKLPGGRGIHCLRWQVALMHNKPFGRSTQRNCRCWGNNALFKLTSWNFHQRGTGCSASYFKRFQVETNRNQTHWVKTYQF